MELTRKALLRAAVAFGFFWACSPEEQDPGDGDGRNDAGSDGGGTGNDAGPDAGPGGPDAGPDGGPDAGPDVDAGTDAGTEKSCTQNGTVVEIETNHGHALVVSKEDVIAGTEKTYDITGASGHSHSVTLTASDFATLAANVTVQVTSTEGSFHTHAVTVSCA